MLYDYESYLNVEDYCSRFEIPKKWIMDYD